MLCANALVGAWCARERFVMAHGAAEHAHQKSAVLLEEVHHRCPRYGVLMARIS